MIKKIGILLMTMALFSCGGGKYQYLFDTGKQLAFGQGKWILNRTASNSKVFDHELYNASYNQFKEILGDSLIDLNTVRAAALVAPKIKFEPSVPELKKLYVDTKCDYLINIRGNIISNGAGTLSFDNGQVPYSVSNQSSVEIVIYDLKTATVISSAQAIGKDTAENSHFDSDNGLPTFHHSAETLMVKAAKKLIRKYEKYRLDG